MKISSRIISGSSTTLFCVAFFLQMIATAEDNSPIIAIVAENNELDPRAEILSASMSGHKDIKLLDRTRLDYILKEHEILRSQISGRAMDVGKLLSADGLIVLSKLSESGKDYIVYKLLSSKSGTVIDCAAIPLDNESEISSWIKLLANRLPSSLPKLKFTRDELVHVSLLNIRSINPDRNAENIARQLVKILSLSLAQIENLILTDRWDLEKLAVEKFISADIENFKTAQIILDGDCEISEKEILVNIRLNKKGAESKIIKFNGKSNEIPALAAKIATQIASICNAKLAEAKDSSWSAEQEISRLKDEAKWALACGRYEQAKDAADSAWALGNHSHETAFLRFKAYGGKEFNKYSNVNRFIYNGMSVTITHEDLMATPKDEIENCIQMLLIYEEYLQENKQIPPNDIDPRGYCNGKARNGQNIATEVIMFHACRVLVSAFDCGLHQDQSCMRKIRIIQEMLPRIFKLGRKIYARDEVHTELMGRMLAYYVRYWFNDGEPLMQYMLNLLSQKDESGSPDFQLRKSMAGTTGHFKEAHKQKKDKGEASFLLPEYCREDAQNVETTKNKWNTHVDRLLASKNDMDIIDGVVLLGLIHPIAPYNSDNMTRCPLCQNNIIKKIKILSMKSAKDYSANSNAARKFTILSEIINTILVHGERFALDDKILSFEFVVELANELIKNNRNVPWRTLHNELDLWRIISICRNKDIIKEIQSNFNDYKKNKAVKGEDFNGLSDFDWVCQKSLGLTNKGKKAPLKITDIRTIEIDPFPISTAGMISKNINIYDEKVFITIAKSICSASKNPPELKLSIYDIAAKQLTEHKILDELNGRKLFEFEKIPDSWRKKEYYICFFPYNGRDYNIVGVLQNGLLIKHLRSGKWALLDELQISDIIDACLVGNELFLSFSENAEIEKISKPCGLMAYSLDTGKKRILISNQKLIDKNPLEQFDRFQIRSLFLFDNKLFFIIQLEKKKGYISYINLHDSNIKILKLMNTNDLVINALGGNPIAYWPWCYLISDFNSMQNSIDRRIYCYCPDSTHNSSSWQWNMAVRPYNELTINADGEIFSLETPDKDGLHNCHIAHYWRKNNPKQVIIPVLLKTKTEKEPAAITEVVTANDKYICVLGRSSTDFNSSSTEKNLMLWTFKLDDIRNYAARKLDYPFIYPYSWDYYPPEKEFNFVRRQKVTIERQYDGALVKYTTDGSIPNANSPIYEKPFIIDKSQKVCARVFKDGFHSSDPFTVEYRKIPPKRFFAAKFANSKSDILLADCNYVLKTPEDENGDSSHVIPHPPNHEGSFVIGDWDGDGLSDIALLKGKTISFFKNWNEAPEKQSNYPQQFDARHVIVGNFNTDNKDTASWWDKGGKVFIELNGDTIADKELQYNLEDIDNVFAADTDGDGKDELIVCSGDKFYADEDLNGSPDSEFTSKTPMQKDSICIFGDWDGDGKDTLAIWQENKLIHPETSK